MSEESSQNNYNEGSSSSQQHHYTVLYYKRKNKVHKSKGVSKLDGYLTIDPPPKSTVTLLADDDSNNRKVVFRGIQKDIANGRGSFEVDDIIQIGANEVEIVSIENNNNNNNSYNNETSSTTKSLPGSAATTTTTKRRGLPVPKFRTPNRNLFRPVTSTSLNKKKSLSSTPIPYRSIVGGGGSVGGSNGQKQQHSYKRPPAQPKKQTQHQQSDDSDESSDDDSSSNRNVVVPQPQHVTSVVAHLPSKKRTLLHATINNNNNNKPLLPFKHPKTTSAFRRVSGTTATTTTRTQPGRQAQQLHQKSSNNPLSTTKEKFFPGAIGNLDVPHSIKNVLKPHQIEGVVFLWNCLTGSTNAASVSPHSEPNAVYNGSILADEMGLGKTLMTIAVICALHRKNRNMRFVVVCPSSLVVNWNVEFDKWLGKASNPKRVVVKKGGEQGSSRLKAFCQVKSGLQSEVLIISYDLFRLNSNLFQQVKRIALLVVDEGHRLKNTNGSLTLSALQSIPCEAKLCITATPIQNNLSDFFSIANFVCPGLLGDLSSFRKEYERPISAMNNKNCSAEQRRRGKEQSSILDNIIKTFMIRRLTKDTLKKMLPPRSEVLVFCRPTELQCQLYRQIARQQSPDSTSSGQTSDALTTLIILRKLCSHPSLINQDKSSLIVPPSSDASSFLDSSGKLKTLNLLLAQIRKDEPQDKVVIVSNFTTALSTIEDAILKPQGYTFVRLDGTIELSKRQQTVDTFNKTSPERSFIFLLSSKAGGCGLNLIGANRLVMFDPDWNPASDSQAMARVYRTGQEKKTIIYRLFTTGTVEEVICQRQIQKGNLASLAVDSAGKGSNKQDKFTKEELRDCFTLKNVDCDTKVKLGDSWPSYNGISSIESEGCTDKPLLAVAADNRSPISFVHVVKTSDEPFDFSSDDEFMDTIGSSSDNGESSGEENEF